MDKELSRLGFTVDELHQIAEMYEQCLNYNEMSEKLLKTVNRGTVDYVRKMLSIPKRKRIKGNSKSYKNLIMSNEDLIRQMAKDGYNTTDICNKIGLPRHQSTSIRYYLKDISTTIYHTYSPEIQSGVIHDYTVELMSVTEIGKKYGMDSTTAQTILKNKGLLRHFYDTHSIKREAGKYNYTGTTQHRYKGKDGGTFSKKLKDSIIEQFLSKCVCCGETNDQHKERLNKSLCVHHIYPYSACKENLEHNLIPLCYECHRFVHRQMEKEKSIYKALGSHYRDGLDMSELFFDLFDTDRIADLKIASLDLGSA